METPASPLSMTATARNVDLLVEGSDGQELSALATIREAARSHEASMAGEPSEPHDDAATATIAEASVGGQLVRRVTTPERLRRASARLYGDIRDIMERHDARNGRERELQRRGSRESRISYLDTRTRSPRRSTTTTASPAAAPAAVAAPHAPPAETVELPNVHQLFEESRRAYLEEAQQQRTYFPSSSKPTTYSSKDPGTFSQRFRTRSSNGRAP